MKRYLSSAVLACSFFASSAIAQINEELYPEDKQHKRIEWLKQLDESGPNKDVRSALQNAYRQFGAMGSKRAMKQASFDAWQLVGTSQENRVSGRASSIAFHPTNEAILYLATAQGGLWRTSDVGNTWVNLSSSWATLAMGAVAVDPKNPRVIYAGTGDHAGPDGIGLLKSTDEGLNWMLVANSDQLGDKIVRILIDPNDPNRIYLSSDNGVYRSLDAGANWTKVLSMSGLATIALNQQDPNNIIAAAGTQVRRSTDGGNMWETVGVGLPGSNRTVVSMSPTDANYVYLSLSVNGNSQVARSTDNGVNWEVISTSVDYLGDQGWYANAIAVDPKNPKTYVVGGLDVYRSANGNALAKRSSWTASSGSTNFTHADIQYLAYGIDALYCLSDGGIYRSEDWGLTWKQYMNAKLATLQFMGFDADPNVSFYVGGTQDNGVNRTTAVDQPFDEVAGGDGGRTWVGQNDPNIVYSTYVYANLQRSDDGGRTWRRGPRGDHNIITNDTLVNEGAPFYMQYAVNDADAGMVAISGQRRVWVSYDGGENFTSAMKSGVISGGPNFTHWPEANQGVMYVGGRGGYFHYTTDYGESWNKSATKIGTASGIDSHPLDAAKVYVAISGYGGKHFYMSTNYGETWTTPATNFPDVSCLSIAVSKEGVIYIGHQLGVIYSRDNGVTWEPLREGLPLVQIMSLSIRGGEDNTYLLAGTYGRGAYRLNISEINQQTNDVALNEKVEVFTKLSTNVIERSTPVRLTVNASSSDVVSVQLYDYLGREVSNLFVGHVSGAPIQLDLSNVSAGKYFVVTNTGGKSNSLPITVL